MNVIEQARQAYAPTSYSVQTPRSVESKLLGQITSQLKKCAAATNFPNLVTALYENRRFWTTMAADVADANNQLPEELRAQIFYLAEFTEHHSRLVLAGAATADILVEVNTSVMRGLNGETAVA